MILPKVAVDAKIILQEELGNAVWKMVLACPEIAATAQPGMFVQLRVERGNLLLRRPISLADVNLTEGTLTLIYRLVGKGTKALADCQVGASVNVLGPLGHGFDTTAKKPLLVGGGMGIAPLLFLAKSFAGKSDILMGGRNKAEMFWPGIYRDLVHEIFVTTDDGSMGTKGFTVTKLPELLASHAYDCVMVCGPEIMMRGVAKITAEAKIPCQVSLEKRMACGLGACLSCSIDTNFGERKKVCKDGPVFWAKEVF